MSDSPEHEPVVIPGPAPTPSIVPRGDSPNPLLRLLGSSKALVTLLVVVCSFAGLYLGKAQWAQVEDLLKWVLPAWLLAHGAEDVAKHVGAAKAQLHSSR